MNKPMQTDMRNLQIKIDPFYQKVKLIPNIIGLKNSAKTAIVIISSILEARESRGTHYFIEDAE